MVDAAGKGRAKPREAEPHVVEAKVPVSVHIETTDELTLEDHEEDDEAEEHIGSDERRAGEGAFWQSARPARFTQLGVLVLEVGLDT